MTIQISGNTTLSAAYPGTAQSTCGRENYTTVSDVAAGLFVFTDADGTEGTVEVIASGNVPANVQEIAGVTEYLPGKSCSGAAGEQYAALDAVSVITSGRCWVQAVEDSLGSIVAGKPAYCSITANYGKATDTSSGQLLAGVFRSGLNADNAALVEVKLSYLAASTESTDDVVSATVASPTATVIATRVIDHACTLISFGVDIATCGTAGNNTVILNKNGTPITSATITIAHDDPDGTSEFLGVADFGSVTFAQGDLLTIEVTAAATAVAGLNAVARVRHAL